MWTVHAVSLMVEHRCMLLHRTSLSTLPESCSPMPRIHLPSTSVADNRLVQQLFVTAMLTDLLYECCFVLPLVDWVISWDTFAVSRFLQCFDTVDWMTGKHLQHLYQLSSPQRFSSAMVWGRKLGLNSGKYVVVNCKPSMLWHCWLGARKSVGFVKLGW